MPDQVVVSFATTSQTITARVLSECLRTYGASIDELTLESWVTSTLSSLLTEETRVTQFVQLLAMRDIREWAATYLPAEAA